MGLCLAENHVIPTWRWRSESRVLGSVVSGLEQKPAMGQRLIISDNRDDPGNPLVLDGEAIDAAAKDPLAIGQLMVDQVYVWAEGTDPTGGGLYYERNSHRHRHLQAFETGSEDMMTGGWVRIHGTHREVLLVEFLDVPRG